MAEPYTSSSTGISPNSPIWHDGLTIDVAIKPSILNVSSGQVSSSQVAIAQLDFSEISFNQAGTSQVAVSKSGSSEFSAIQNCPFQDGFFQPTEDDTRVAQIGVTEINLVKINLSQVGTSEISSTQISSGRISETQPILISGEIPLSRSIKFPQVIVSNPGLSLTTVETHNTSPISIYNINNTALTLWNAYLQPTTPLNLTIEIKDLPIGQLAEAQVTQFSNNGTPTGGILSLDYNANGLGWFIDTTPWDNTEYSQPLTDTAYRATADSAAYGHYDLLTTLLHETAHLQGFIAGYSNYDRHIQTQNGSKNFVGDGFSAILTPDGSHLNSQVVRVDLMNTTLTPGVRKLPSALDIAILNTLRQPTSLTAQTALLTAPLSAGALIAINNGSYSLRERFANDTNTDWYTRGDSQILNGQAVLSEDSPYLSHLSQTFVIPQGAKALQFTLVNTNLHSSNTRLAPGDAFVGGACA